MLETTEKKKKKGILPYNELMVLDESLLLGRVFDILQPAGLSPCKNTLVLRKISLFEY